VRIGIARRVGALRSRLFFSLLGCPEGIFLDLSQEASLARAILKMPVVVPFLDGFTVAAYLQVTNQNSARQRNQVLMNTAI